MGKYNFAVMKNTQPMKNDIFISYSRKDSSKVEAFVEMLKERIPGIEIWIDLKGVEAGDEFDDVIMNAIEASSYVIFMVSSNSNSVGDGLSKWTKDELDYAARMAKTVIPVLLEDIELSNWFVFRFGRVDCIDSKNSNQVERFLRLLSRKIGKSLLPLEVEYDAYAKMVTRPDIKEKLTEAEEINSRLNRIKLLSKVIGGTILLAASVIGLLVCFHSFLINPNVVVQSLLAIILIVVALVVCFPLINRLSLKYTINETGSAMTAGVKIGYYPFKRVSIPKTTKIKGVTYEVTRIDDVAFSGWDLLESVCLPNTIKSIGRWAFSMTSLQSANIPCGVERIDDNAYSMCELLTSVSISNTVKDIGDGAFSGCTRLDTIFIPNSVKSIGYGAFADCWSLISMSVASDNVEYDSRDNCNAIIETDTNTLVAGCRDTIIPSSVTGIAQDAFYGRRSMVSLHIPSGVLRIGKKALAGCVYLDALSVASDNAYYDSRDNCNAIIETATNTLVAGCRNTVIPTTVTSIGHAAFYGIGIQRIVIPESVTSIGDMAFAGCDDLVEIKYAGTQAQWMSIKKGNKWNMHTFVHKVKCADGDLKIDIRII